MAVKWSVTMRNGVLNAWETTMGTSPRVRVYTGAAPTNIGDAATGTLLIEYVLASDWAANAASGSKSLNNLPIAGTAAQTGSAGYYRFYASDGTTCHEQGTVTASGGGGDITVSNTSMTVGQTVNLTGFTLVAPRA